MNSYRESEHAEQPVYHGCVAKTPGWFADVLADSELILGIRNNYMNVYWLGQSLFKIKRNGKTGSLEFSTHPKYLVDPDLSKAVPFDGSAFMVEKPEPLVYEGVKTLDRMKRAAKIYGGYEKTGVQAVAHTTGNVIDTEVAFRREGESDKKRTAPRMDLACLEEVEGSIWLRFWEAKLYTNMEIRAHGDTDAPVVGQIKGYRHLVEEHREEIIESYHKVACNLVAMAKWVAPERKVDPLVKRVAGGEPLEIDKPPMVGLVIYDYDDAQKRSERWKNDLGKLEKEGIHVQYAGDAKDIKLRGPILIAIS